MFVASYHNTMAHARPKFPQIEVEVVKIDDGRERRQAQRDLRAAYLARQRQEANDAIMRANRALRKMNGGTGEAFERILTRMCKATGIRRQELMSSRRHKSVTLVRQAVIYWTCRLTALSLPQIGKKMNKDHTSVLHAKRRYPERRAEMGRYLREVR